ncbi:MAG: DUF4397 domain-containing protein, partial [Polyangiaceae bacterium]
MRAFNKRHLVVVAALCGSFSAFAACGGDDDTTGSGGAGGSTGGSGGTAGKGGAAGKDGGTADTGGKGGAAGSAGATGGSAGTAGKGGSAGAAGSGGAAGKGGSAGAAGSSGKGGAAGSTGDGGMTDASTDGDAGGTANVRVAHLSPGAPPVDFCLAVHGTTVFTGPVLAGQAVLTGLPYASVTKYLSVSAAQYDVRIVAPGSLNCATSLGGLPDQTNLPAIPAGGAVTIAAIGEITPGDAGGQPFALKAYVDDTSVTSGSAKLRFIHASSGTPSVDVGTNGGAIFNGIFNDVAFGNTATMTNGYVETAPLADAEISARTHGATSDVLSATGVNLASGSIATAFAIGKTGSTLAPLKILWCGDNAPPAGALTPCAIVGDDPKRAHVRVAHLSPDAPAVDVCLAKTGAPFTGAGVLRRLNVTAGLAYSQVTTYLDLPLGSYTVRLVAATATDCASAAVPDTSGVTVIDNLYATVAALGDFTVPPTDGGAPDGGSSDAGTSDAGTPPSSFGLKVFVDNKAAPIPAGNINLRFIHASPGTAAVDVGLGSAGSFVPVFANVGFRNFGAGVGIDPNGYVSRAPLAAQTISARLSGGTTDAIVVPNVTITADSLATAFAIGKVGDATKPLKVLLCLDSNAPAGALTS